MAVTAARRAFSAPVMAALTADKILGVRAGTRDHRFLGVWMVVVKGRLFVRTWNDKPEGWFRVFLDDARGAIQLVNGRTIPIRARLARGARLLDAIDAAYAEKYPTPGSRQYVRGFATARRRTKTLELLPR